jgi:hypothetical protein
MDEGKRREEQNRGERAKALMRDPLIVEAFDVLEEKYVGAWKDSFQMYQALMVVRGHLSEVIETGDLAKLELNSKRIRRGD